MDAQAEVPLPLDAAAEVLHQVEAAGAEEREVAVQMDVDAELGVDPELPLGAGRDRHAVEDRAVDAVVGRPGAEEAVDRAHGDDADEVEPDELVLAAAAVVARLPVADL